MDELLYIIRFLNLVDLCTVLYRANRLFKRILEVNNNILTRIDLTALPFVSLPYVNKLLNPRKRINSLLMSTQYNLQDV